MSNADKEPTSGLAVRSLLASVDRSDSRALFAFGVAASLGSFAILNGQPWWIACTVVVAFTLVILQRQQSARWATSDAVKDSPYYLGFILTQIALVQIFLKFDPSYADAIIRVSQHVATALSTSIVGLIGRHAVVLLDPDASRRKATLQTLEQGIKESIALYQTAQASFVGLVREFIDERSALMTAEQEASRAYVRELRASITTMTQLQKRLTTDLTNTSDNLVASLSRHLSSLSSASEATTEVLHRITAQLERSGSAADTAIRDVQILLKDSAPASALVALGQSARQANTGLVEFISGSRDVVAIADSVGRLARSVEADLRAIDALLSDFVNIAKSRIEDLRSLDGSRERTLG